MILQNYILKKFEEGPTETNSIVVDKTAIFLKVIPTQDALVAFYAVNAIESGEQREDKFAIVFTGRPIPANAEFIDIINMIMEEEGGGQSVVLFPVFKIKS